ncbi:RNA polymerase sigma factor [Pontibacter akesuensis]|uniref:RNA polymerase sigma-70 factor, ECF subfamily n=1 Tax=Pontibacter akesuensis TaxID=388950 RepID=A0A1I7G964_9BACT|nr:sigma-70 family RNA polymerase sigma factor [Pontibacter akesuensis]GHA57993.1 DNA-directed RNA polymerase sigma-70 factor [Pontibacter akesuensis]SFU44977.1 RNA polymerase sigma-70 factor, ECF subfamily [Pontibacter akesuensis]
MLPIFLKLFSNTKPPPDDLELVRLYRQSGDMTHLGDLFQRHTEMVYLVCLKYLKDEEESKDATMQLFEHLATALLKHDITNFKSWLHVTTKNHCLMQLRSKKKRQSINLEDLPPALMENKADLHLIEAETPDKVEQVLAEGMAGLPPEQRQCVEMFYLQQKSYKEIAALTGCELSKVKSYIQNGKRNLKIYMEKNHAPQ